MTDWQNGGPTPAGMGVYCTGCRDCEKEGHLPFPKRFSVVQQHDVIFWVTKGPEIPSITCPQCKRTSYNPNDIRERYCGFCHQWHDEMEVGHVQDQL